MTASGGGNPGRFSVSCVPQRPGRGRTSKGEPPMAEENSDSRGEVRQSFYAKQQLINSARSAFQQLSAIMKNATIYPEAHPFLMTSADKLRSSVEELLVGRKEIAFYLVRGELFFETLSVPIDESL